MPKQKIFCDLFLSPIKDSDLLNLILAAKYLGFRKVGLSVEQLIFRGEDISNKYSNNSHQQEFSKRIKKFSSSFHYILIKMRDFLDHFEKVISPTRAYLRITLLPNEFKTVRKQLKKISEENLAIISLRVENEKELRYFLSNQTINLFSISIVDVPKVLSMSSYHLIKQFRKPIELTLNDFTYLNFKDKIRLISKIRGINRILNKKDLILIISSGASCIEDMRSPRIIRSFLRFLGFKEGTILGGISKNPDRFTEFPRDFFFYKSESK